MDPTDVIAHAQDSLTVRCAFGEPIIFDGVTVIPAARIAGGGGAGRGPGAADERRPDGGSGGG